MRPYSNKNEMMHLILRATDKLMAKEGLQNISMHKIAKEAGIASGTLYLYFENKDELLNCLIKDIYAQFHQYLSENFNANLTLEAQYQQLWQLKWDFLNNNPTLTANLNQYRALLGFGALIRCQMENPDAHWNQFVLQGKSQGVIVDLPNHILFKLSIGICVELAYSQLLSDMPMTQNMLDTIIQRTWKTITI